MHALTSPSAIERFSPPGLTLFARPTSDRPAQDGESSLFKAGSPGPKDPIPFHDGAVKVISTYTRIRSGSSGSSIRFRISRGFLKTLLPDYVLPIRDADARMAAAHWRMNSRRVFALWLGARLTDNLGTPYVGSLGPYVSGLKGQVSFTPSAPPGARQLKLTLHDLSASIPLGFP